MRKTSLFTVFLSVVAIVMAGCSDDGDVDYSYTGVYEEEAEGRVALQLSATLATADISTDVMTRAVYDDYVKTSWTTGDTIGVFMYSNTNSCLTDTNVAYVFSNDDNKFVPVSDTIWVPQGEAGGVVYAYYPYDGSVIIRDTIDSREVDERMLWISDTLTVTAKSPDPELKMQCLFSVVCIQVTDYYGVAYNEKTDTLQATDTADVSMKFANVRWRGIVKLQRPYTLDDRLSVSSATRYTATQTADAKWDNNKMWFCTCLWPQPTSKITVSIDGKTGYEDNEFSLNDAVDTLKMGNIYQFQVLIYLKGDEEEDYGYAIQAKTVELK